MMECLTFLPVPDLTNGVHLLNVVGSGITVDWHYVRSKWLVET
jgi:hypothetical protein